MDADAYAAGEGEPADGQLPPAAESGLSESGSHRVEAKRQGRGKLTRGFGELRAVVPAATGTDRASLLSDAVSHIKHLIGRVEELEGEAGKEKSLPNAAGSSSKASSSPLPEAGAEAQAGVRVEVSMLGPETAVIMVTSGRSVKDPTTKLMEVLSEMDYVEVKQAAAAKVEETMVQNVIVKLLAADKIAGHGDWLKAAIISGMYQR